MPRHVPRRAEGPCGRLIGRRGLLAGAGAAWAAGATNVAGMLSARPARGDVDPGWRPNDLDVREVHVDGTLSRVFTLATPKHLAAGERVPLAVLLHGLGETGDPRMGAWAWLERYGLGSSYDRLRAGGRLRGLVLVCPYMPDLPVGDPHAFDDYAAWLTGTVLPRARREAPMAQAAPAYSYLAGCSLGGHFSIELLLRTPDAWGAWAGVQTAISAPAGERYARRLAALQLGRAPGPGAGAGGGRPALLVETSTEDPFRAGSEALDRALGQAGAARTFVELPGPHDQPWLRRSGTARMLQWLDDLPRPEHRGPQPDRPAAPL